ncbi:MAG: hypothetical protein LBP21_00460, partial [Synergistaceae bacterium]|nr:hypothetical protein [Synergistaceae bacterium]
MAKQSRKKFNPADENFQAGKKAVSSHPMFAPLACRASIWRYANYPNNRLPNLCPEKAWAVVISYGVIHCHPKRRGEAEEWVYVIAHCLLHLGLEHFSPPPKENKIAWNAACDCYIAKFLYDLKIGRPPSGIGDPRELTAQTELDLYEHFTERGIPKDLLAFGTADNLPDMLDEGAPRDLRGKPIDMQWGSQLAAGISMAVSCAVSVAGGAANSLDDSGMRKTTALGARDWFISSYPLLGAIAANFKVVEDPALCARMAISVAAINVSMREIYVNPAAALTLGECKFVMAHEFLHAGLRHDARAEGRDPYLWNVACDYVINDWLVQMDVGEIPRMGLLHDKELRGLSAESVYDRIVTDIRKARKLATLRGVGLGDILGGEDGNWQKHGDGLTLDDFYRNSLSQGLSYHEEQGKGYLPAGLIEEIRALSYPPISWDVELAKWFDSFFSPLEKRRSYARLSRRQSSTPDIPRASWVEKEDSEYGRTFGVLLDTSGSMNRVLLAKA